MEPPVPEILGPPMWGASVMLGSMVRLNGSTLRERSRVSSVGAWDRWR